MYLLYKLQDGPESIRAIPFNSAAECETFRKNMPKTIEVVRYSCEVYVAGSEPPAWYTNYFDQKPIHGVPLDPRHMR